MPHTRSAKKALRKNLKRRTHNRAMKKQIKRQIRAYMEAIEENDLEGAKEEFALVAKHMDKAASRRIIHPNKAARKKSRLARLMAPKETATAAEE